MTMPRAVRGFAAVALMTAAFAAAPASDAQATVVLDPATGAQDLNFEWGGTAGTGLYTPIESIGGQAGNLVEITVGLESVIDIFIEDAFIIGDAFAIELDGVLLTPTSGNMGADARGAGATSYYSALYDDVLLTAGTHSFGLFLTDSCCDGGGGADVDFSAATPAASTVPLPGALPLLAAALGGFALIRRRG